MQLLPYFPRILLIFLLCPCVLPKPLEEEFPFADHAYNLYRKASASSPSMQAFMNTCLGPGSQNQQGVFRESLPAQWPSGDPGNPFCMDTNLVKSRLCSEKEISFYAEFMVETSNPEMIPSTGVCMSGKEINGCWPGFFSVGQKELPCCDGFFCPHMLTCMIPCPLGSYCRKAKPEAGPKKYNRSTEEWCSPYAYKSRLGKCGGADKWSVGPQGAFAGDEWAYGSGSIYCPGGSYCPTTIDAPIRCSAKSFCRVGSVAETHCPLLVTCNGHTKPVSNNKGVVLIAVVIFLLAVIWQASKVRERLRRNMGPKEALQFCLQPHTMRIVVPDNANTTGHSGNRIYEGVSSLVATAATSIKSLSGCLDGDLQELMVPDLAESDTVDFDLRLDSINEGSMRPNPLFGDVGTMSMTLDNVSLTDLRPTIEFYSVSMHLKSCRKCVLASASGVFHKSRLTAIMGPSGAGKTSLLNALAGKAGYGDISGLILVNGEEESLEKYKPVMGFVPQNDIMHTNLTVAENLQFSARYRLPAGTSRSAIVASVERAIEVLGLSCVRNELIGCETTRGISGGQRKRVNVGLEIVADPLILFLDEPTSGLDSSSCRQVVAALQTIAHMGVTSAAVVHQPSHRVLCLFDDILLLGNSGQARFVWDLQGGTTVYTGPQECAKLYFERIGFVFPSMANPSDVFMDIMTGQHERIEDPDFLPENLFDLWQQSDMRRDQFTNPELERACSAQMQNGRTLEAFEIEEYQSLNLGRLGDGCCSAVSSFPVLALVLLVNGISRLVDAGKAGCRLLSSIITDLRSKFILQHKYTGIGSSNALALRRNTPGFIDQLYWCLGRALTQRLRNPLGAFMELSLYSLTGMALGFLADSRDTPGLHAVQIDMMNYSIGIGLLSCVSALRTFGLARAVFFRESACGINRFSFFMAHDIFGIAGTFIFSLCFSSLYRTFAQPQGTYVGMYVVAVSLMYAWTGLGYCLSQVMAYSSAQLASAVLVLLDALVSRPSFGSSPLTHAIRLFSFSRWAVQCAIIVEASRLKGVWLLERCIFLNNLDFPVSSFTSSLFAILGLGLFSRIVACIMLFIVDKHKQQ